MKIKALIYFIAGSVVLVSASCSPVADLSNPKFFENELITFSYPGNWEIDENVREDYGYRISISGPENSVVILLVISPGWEMNFEDYCKQYSEMLKDNISLGKITRTELSDVVVHPNGMETCQLSLTLSILSENINSTAKFWKIGSGGIAVIGMTQVADEDREKLLDGFRLIEDNITISPQE